MKDFFKYVFATMVGIILSSLALGLIFVLLIVGLFTVGSKEKKIEISQKSVLCLNLDQNITERTPNNSLKDMPFFRRYDSESIGFVDIINALEKAKTDPNIKCVYLTVTEPKTGFAKLREIRNALIDFKKSNKKIIAYSEVYTQSAYYLASVADKVYLNPQGIFDFKGFNSQITFFKGALDKIGVEAQIIRVGKYKSAVEPFVNTKMSDENRKQVSDYLNEFYNIFLDDISNTRHIDAKTLAWIADTYQIQQPKDALQYKMIDGLKYKDEVIDILKLESNTNKKDNINTVNINDYAETAILTSNSRDKIAIVYADGEITDGEGAEEQIGSDKLSRTIRKLREDKHIKAIVLRINSPGGSALASDVIWREVLLTQKVKPIIASLGDVAASGGYYIACAADSIIVQPNTITGSIGVFGIIPNLQNLFNNKLGITFDGVKTGQYADIESTTKPLSQGEKLIIQNSVNHVYDTFLTRVADGRKKPKQYIDGIAGGHVWTGIAAVKNGLADRLGSFEDAILAAAKKAKLRNYKLVEYPEKADVLESLFEQGSKEISTYYTKKELGEHYLIYQKIKKATKLSGIQAKMEYELNIN